MTDTQMLINYTPGESCRIAVVEDGKLQELHAEHMDAVSRVGNIYVGRVHNVEESIQAAFVDFGVGINGFLHVSDVHPRYFPGDEDATERVGKKTPRRDRPPIQRCFKRGQEVIVQVLKEGVGSKGPTLTSYLSIPGRFLVMMPHMDKVGVSRNVEDEEARRDMRKILDALDLPKEFGFILRTAGFDRNKTELKRDLAYLQRLWKDMETRRKKGKKPRLLYSESDLLLRSIRDHLGSDVSEVIIDSELAIRRAARFMKIVAPRTTTKLKRYTGAAPIFHAFGVEPQITAMHAREVPLPSGGRLVIDETEALVAIDVNSGRSRSARDAETNAYKTNMEAAEEICRQLRLRDLGGLVINDLIDMRESKHRKAVEQKFKDLLKRDRAKSTILPISGFGIMEMTRQRMRGSHERQHFTPCPLCHERGLIQKPPSVAADALREVEALLQHQKIAKIELVVSSRVAGELLSAKRRTIGRIERMTGKRIDVRISEAIPMDRFTVYAYDTTGSDVDLERLGKASFPKAVVDYQEAAREGADWAQDLGLEADEAEDAAVEGEHTETELQPFERDAEEPAPDFDADEEEDASAAPSGEGVGKKKRRRRRRGRGKGRGEGESEGEGRPERDEPAQPEDAEASSESESDAEAREGEEGGATEEGGGKKKRRRRRRRRRRRDGEETESAGASDDSGDDSGDESAEASESKSSTARSGRGPRMEAEDGTLSWAGDSDAEAPAEASSEEDGASEEGPAKKKRRRRSKKKAGASSPASESPAPEPEPEEGAKGASRRKAGRSRRSGASAEAKPKDAPKKAAEAKPAKASETVQPVVKKVRALYGRGRRKLTPAERAQIKAEE